MEKIDKFKIMSSIKIFIFFIYLLFFYIFGANSETVKYSGIILILFLGLEFIRISKVKKIKYNVPIIIAFIFAFYCFLSNFWAINANLSIDRAKTLFILAIFLTVTYNFFIDIENGEEKLLKIIMWAGVVFSIYVISYYGVGTYFTKLINGERVGAEINNVNAVGLQTSISCIIAIFYGLYDNKKAYFLLSLIPLIVSLGTGSRKVLILIALGVVLMFLLKKDEKKDIKKTIKTIILFIIIIAISIYIVKLPIFSNTLERMQGLINGFIGEGTVDHSTQLRKSYIKAGIDQFLKKPMLGVGVANSIYITMEAEGYATYLHNNFVELLATTGIIGFCLYYSIYAYIIIWSMKLLKKKNKYINITLVIILVNLILDYGVVSYYAKSTYLYFLLGLITIEKMRKEVINEKNS